MSNRQTADNTYVSFMSERSYEKKGNQVSVVHSGLRAVDGV